MASPQLAVPRPVDSDPTLVDVVAPVRKRAWSGTFVRSAPALPADGREAIARTVAELRSWLGTRTGVLLDALDRLPRDPSTRAAGATLRARVDELRALERALFALAVDLQRNALEPLLRRGEALGMYLRSLRVWARKVLSVLTKVARGVRAMDADWAELRREIDASKEWYFGELARAIRLDVALLPTGDPRVLDRVQAVLDASERLHEGLDERFG
jgi:hypothetical protein